MLDFCCFFVANISIHAPRTGSDRLFCWDVVYHAISIHAPRTGSDNINQLVADNGTISIHAPRTGSDCCNHSITIIHKISIHAPRTGSDTKIIRSRLCGTHFNPRSPHGERHNFSSSVMYFPNFNPRSPHGERLAALLHALYIFAFQSTLPARGATAQSNNSVDQNHRLCTKSIPQNSPFEN